MKKDDMKRDRDFKEPMPPEFIPTELGSAVFASVDASPTDEEYLIMDENSRDDVEDGAGNARKEKK